jgi:5'-nucleotidase
MCHSAMLTYRLNATTPGAAGPDFALINAGGIRATIDEGPITRGEVLTAFPFGNAIVEITMSGEQLWKTLEGIIAKVNVDNGKPVTSFLQVSRGIVIEYGPGAAAGANSSSSDVLVAVTIGGKPLDKAAQYKVVTLDFVANGGDNFFSVKFDNLVVLDTLDEVVTAHVAATSPVDVALDGRLNVVSRCKVAARRAKMRRAARKVSV